MSLPIGASPLRRGLDRPSGNLDFPNLSTVEWLHLRGQIVPNGIAMFASASSLGPRRNRQRRALSNFGTGWAFGWSAAFSGQSAFHLMTPYL